MIDAEPVSPSGVLPASSPQPRDVAGTDYALNQLVLRAEVAVWRPAGFRRVSNAS